MGNIGRKTAERAAAFGMNIVGWSRSLTPETASESGVRYGGTSREELLEMISHCDAVSIHLAKAAETVGTCDEVFFSAMRDGAYFINTSRGTVVDEPSLIRAIKEKGIRAGLDVFADQPSEKHASWTCDLVGLPGVCTTHHIGASTDQAQSAVGDETARIIEVFLREGRFENCVNREMLVNSCIEAAPDATATSRTEG